MDSAAKKQEVGGADVAESATAPSPVAAAPDAPPADAAPQAPLRPTIVFAVERGINESQIEKQFRDEGMTLVFAKSEDDVLREIQKPECFVVFISLDFNKNGIRIMQKNVPQTHAYWLLIAGHLSTQKRTALLQAGATDLLVAPVNAAQFKLRAKGLLARYLKSFDMPKEVILPPGFSHREDQSIVRTAQNNEGGAGGYNHRSGGEAGSDQAGYNHLRGEDGAGHDHRVHDLSRDEHNAAWNNHASGKDAQAAWNNHQSTKEEGAAWNNHGGANSPEDKVPSFARNGGDETNPEWRNHGKGGGANGGHEGHREQSGPNGDPQWNVRVPQADSQTPWTNAAAGPEGAHPPTRHSHHGQEPPAPTWQPAPTKQEEEAARRKLESEAAERRLLEEAERQREEQKTAEAAARAAAGSSAAEASSTQAAIAQALAVEAPPVAGASGAATAPAVTTAPEIPDAPLEQITQPLLLLEAIRRKIVLLRTDIPWDPKVWADCSKLAKGAFEGMDRAIADLRGLFKDACLILGASRITLVSFRPMAGMVERPDTLHCLVSSDDSDPRYNEQVLTLLMPHLEVAFEKRHPFFLEGALPTEIEGQQRPASWRVNGRNEVLSAIIPAVIDRSLAVALFVQFDRSMTEATRALLEQAVSYLRLPERHYSMVDFLSRVYRELEAPAPDETKPATSAANAKPGV